MNVDDLIAQNDGNLTPEQAASLLDMAMNGDTAGEAQPNQADSSDAPAVTDDKPGDETPTTDDELNADNAVILTKDGKHTIPYDRLLAEREAAKHWKQQYEQLQAQSQQEIQSAIAQSQQGTQTAEQTAQTMIDAGIDPNIFGDFSEEDLVKGIQTVVQQQVQQHLQQALAPINQKQELDATQQHFQTILDAHPDAESIAESQEFSSWIEQQPSYAKQAINVVLQQGTAGEVVEVLNQFKAAGVTPAVESATDLKAKAQAIVGKTKTPIPASLTDIAGGRVDASTPESKVASMSNGVDILSEMQNWTPEQIERYLNQI